MKCLSMPIADEATPQPTYFKSAISSRPCTVPSSPKGPWSRGKTTSIAGPISTLVASVESIRRRRLSPPPRGRKTCLPSAGNSARAVASVSSTRAASSVRYQRPSLVIPIVTTSYFSWSIAPRTPRAVISEMECSDERPPHSRATVGLVLVSVITSFGFVWGSAPSALAGCRGAFLRFEGAAQQGGG